MQKYLYVGLLVAVAMVGVFLFAHGTKAPPAEPAAVQIPMAEFGGVSLRIEYATTSEARERGLGGRTEIQKDYGMLFVFSKDAQYGFWMKDMLVPIDIFWLDDKGHVVFISADVATSSYPNVFYPPIPVRYVLETAAGFASAHTIATGTPLELQDLPSVSE